MWLIISSATILLILIGVPVIGNLVMDSRPKRGDCLEAKGRGGDTGDVRDFSIVSCGAPTAAYKVAKAGHSIDCNYPYVEMSDSPRYFRNSSRWCLALNAKVGDCFYQEVGFPTGKATKVVCGSSASYRVTAVVPGRADHAVCGPNVDPLNRYVFANPLALAYSSPALTICTVGA